MLRLRTDKFKIRDLKFRQPEMMLLVKRLSEGFEI